MDTAADVLASQSAAPPAPPMNELDAMEQAPPASEGTLVPGSTQPTVNVGTGGDRGQMPTIPMQQDDSTIPYQAPGPDMVMAHAHQREVAGFLSKALSVMAGDKTHHVVTNPDGSIAVHLDESTDKEKWGRIAVAILGGAARGLAVGQGPGGGARAASAGFERGLAMPQEEADRANKEAMDKQQIMMRNAQNAKLNQEVTLGTWNAQHRDEEYLQKQKDWALAHLKEMSDLGLAPLATGVKDPATLAKYGAANPQAVGAHVGEGGDMIYNEPDGNGGVNFYHLPADMATQRTTEPDDAMQLSLDPKDNTKTMENHFTIPAGETRGARATRRMGLLATNDKVIDMAAKNAQAKDTAMPKTLDAMIARRALSTNPVEQAALDRAIAAEAKTPEQRAKVATAQHMAMEDKLIKSKIDLASGGAAAGSAAALGLKGEEYLKAAEVDPAQWVQIRKAANGDVKLPPASSRAAGAQAFRNTVLNYDPTFTDARYDVKQNFKTKKDADTIKSLTTGMAHAERALANSAKLGTSASLLSGRNLSPAAAAYNEDVDFLNGEIGRLITGKSIGVTEGEKLRHNISSPSQEIRDEAISEMLHLAGGKVGAMFQTYKTAAKQDLPVSEFFDAPTQVLLNRYGVTNSSEPDWSSMPKADANAPGGGVPNVLDWNTLPKVNP